MDEAGRRQPGAVAAVGAVWLLAGVSGAAFWTALAAGLVALVTTQDVATTAAGVAQAAAAASVAALAAMLTVGAVAVRRDETRRAAVPVLPVPGRPAPVPAPSR